MSSLGVQPTMDYQGRFFTLEKQLSELNSKFDRMRSDLKDLPDNVAILQSFMWKTN